MKNIHQITSKLNQMIKFVENKKTTMVDEDLWIEVYSTYAQIKPMNQYAYKTIENFDFNHVMTESLFIFKIRFKTNLHNKLRIIFNHRIFEIKRIINFDEKNIVLHIIVLEL